MDRSFQFHRLNSVGIERAEAIAQAFDELLTKLYLHCPDGREAAIVRTKLEEACFFAKKSMAMVPVNQAEKV